MLKTEPVWLSAEDAAVTSLYLKKFSDRATAITTVVQALFGRCCVAAATDDSAALGQLAEDATALGNHILNHPEPAKLGLDPLLLIETEKILAAAGLKSPTLRELHRTMTAELMKQPAEARQNGRVRNIATQLASLGYNASCSVPSQQAAALMKSPDRWFGASVAQLHELADNLVADGRPLDEMRTRILALIGLAELRNYRVDLACVLLRAVFQLGKPCAEATDALNFIALQRRRDGRYGFSNQIVESTIPDEEQHLTVYLPLTVNAVWLFRVAAMA